jgi:hypothetical protein
MVPPAVLNAFAFAGSSLDEEMDAPDLLSGLFFSDGDAYQDGEQVLFSAGQDRSCGKDDQLRKQLSNMHLYRDEFLGTCNAWDEPDDEPEGVPSAFQAMGMFMRRDNAHWSTHLLSGLEDESDNELEDLAALGIASTAGRDSEWDPYGSKTVRS